MKKVIYTGKDKATQSMVMLSNRNSREIELNSLQKLAADPTVNLTIGMRYFNTTAGTEKVLQSINPAVWKTVKYE